MPTEKKLTQLVINKVDSKETMEAMEQAGLINDDELYLVTDGEEEELVLDTTLTVEGGIPDSKAVGDRMTSAEGRLDMVEDRVDPMETKLAGIAAGATANTGTITGVSANGTSVATSGVANIPAASTSAYGVTKLSSATNSTSTTLAATASAVKDAYDRGSTGITNAATAQSTANDALSKANAAQAGVDAIPSWAKESTKPTYTADEVGAENSGAISTHNTSAYAHNDIRTELNNKVSNTDIIPVSRGGTDCTSIVDTDYIVPRYRASSLHSSETNPTINGVICWTYE